MSKPSALKTLFPVIWIVATILMGIAALAGAGHAGFRGDRAIATVIAEVAGPRPGLVAALSAERRPVRSDQVRASMSTLPLAFEANQGQADSRVKYTARAGGYTVFLTADDAVLALRSSSQAATSQEDLTAGIYMHLVGGNSRAQIVASNELPGTTNYFVGRDRRHWQEGVKQYGAVCYKDVYPGVNLTFHGEQRQLEFDFVVAPGAEASAIALRFSGAGKISTDVEGKLTLATEAGKVILHPPVAFQERNGIRQAVDARFVLAADNQVGFALGEYDRSRELVIDPSVSYATYLGGTAEDDGYSIAIDGSGNAYVTGQTKSTDFPTVAGSHSTTNAGSFDVFVTKISADGSTLLYSTYVGGNSDDRGTAIALDASGDAFVAGSTSSTNFPTTSGALQTTYGGAGDAFVFELSSNGAALTFSTYLGGTGPDVANGIAVDGSGNSYIVGETNSTDFPTHNAIQNVLMGVFNGFVTKLNSSGNAMVYSTYLGGTDDFAAAVAVDAAGDAFVTGATKNANFPTTAGAFQTTCGTAANCNGSLSDAFVTVFKPDGSGFVYSTFLGGSNIDQGLAIALDSAGDAYVTGLTQSNTDFPTKSPVQSGGFGGGTQDAFVTELNPTGSALVYSTYLGGSQGDSATSIAVDEIGNAYVTGRTASSDFPTASPTQGALDGTTDAFVSEISSTGSQLVFSTYLGGSLGENTSTLTIGALGGITVDAKGSAIYVTGNTISTDFPLVNAVQGTSGGLIDAFVAKYAQANFTIAATALSPATVTPGSSATSTVTVGALNGFSSSVALTCTVSPVVASGPTCSYNKTSVTPGTPSTLTVATTASTPGGSYTITVTGTAGGFVHSTTVSLGVSDFTISAAALSPVAVDPGGSATSTVTVGALNGFSGSVALTCSVAPATSTPPTCGYSFTSVTPPSASTLTVTSTASTTPANYTITVTGTANGTVHSKTVGLTVNGFHILATTPAAVTAGASGTSTVTLTALGGYSQMVNLTCSVSGNGSPLPACSAASFSINPVTPTTGGATTTLTITTTAPTRAMARRRGNLPAMWLPLAGISLLGMCFISAGTRQRKLMGFLLLVSVMTALFLLPSCGGSNGGGGGGNCAAPPSAPTGLVASSTTGTGTTLTWTTPAVGANCNITGYAIFQDGTQIGTSTSNVFNVTGLSPSTTYSFTVAASDGAGVSPQSAPLSVTTSSGGTPAGNYTVTITGTDANSLSGSTQVILTVN